MEKYWPAAATFRSKYVTQQTGSYTTADNCNMPMNEDNMASTSTPPTNDAAAELDLDLVLDASVRMLEWQRKMKAKEGFRFLSR